jgi:2-polyprenyl-3-methyl-5-hydroxy-6-metoxy-1,4-benzoquinol methylase
MSSSSTPIPQETSTKSGRQIKYVSTLEAYDQWASVYDSDSNPLQALDDEEVISLVPQVLSLATPPKDRPLRILDLGCGTGRNTLKLLSIAGADIHGADLSPKMLDLAKQRCTQTWDSLPKDQRASSLTFHVHDVLSPNTDLYKLQFDIIISTLVVEHLPLSNFFTEVNRLLVPGGILLLSNMHDEMGAKSQAGFNDPLTGEKVRPVSYNHSVEELREEAERNGYELVGEGIRERGVDQEGEMVRRLGPRAEKWLGCKMWMGGIFRRGTA